MARDFDGSTDRIDYTSIFNPKNTSCAVSCWLYGDVIDSHISYILSVNLSDDTTLQNILYINTNGTMAYDWFGSSGDGRWTGATTTTFSVSAWTHYYFHINLGAASWQTMAQIYKNGVQCSYSAQNFGWVGGKTVTGRWAVGGRSSDDARNFNGRIAELAVWKRYLTDPEIAGLAKGLSPLHFPRTLYFYADLVDNIRDIKMGQAGTADGTTVAAHPRIIYPNSVKPMHFIKSTFVPVYNKVISCCEFV